MSSSKKEGLFLINELKSVTIDDRGWLIEINGRSPWLADRDQRKRELPNKLERDERIGAALRGERIRS